MFLLRKHGLMMAHKQKKYFNVERLNDFRGFGGIRLEDNVWITADGCENLTMCPRSPQEVLDVMNGMPWPPEKDTLPGMKRKFVTCNGGKMEMLDLEKS